MSLSASVVCGAAMAVAQPAAPLPQPATPAKVAEPEKKPVRTIDPAAVKLLEEAAAKSGKLRDVSFDVTKKSSDEEVVASVSILMESPGKLFPLRTYRFALKDSKGQRTREWSADGKQVWMLDHRTKKAFSMAAGSDVPAPMDLFMALPDGAFDSMAKPAGSNQVEAVFLADAEVAGVKCRVVRETSEAVMEDEVDGAKPRTMTETIVRYLGPDLFVRKTQFEVSAGDGVNDWKTEAVVSNLKVDAGLRANGFTIKTPDGYTVEKGTLKNMGLENSAAIHPDCEKGERKEFNAKVGTPANPFTLKTPDGKEVTLDSLKGRVVLLDFWATWCGPCKKAMPTLQEISEKYADKSVSVIGVLCSDTREEAAAKYMSDKKFTYTLLLKGDDLASSYGITGLPTMILIGKDGKIAQTWVGFDPDEKAKIGEAVEKALAGK